MKFNKLFAAALVALGIVAAGSACATEALAAAEPTADESDLTEADESVVMPNITFSTYRGRNTKDEYHSFAGADGNVYLFLPSDANLSRVSVKSSEDMLSTTLGTIGSDGRTLSGDFSSQPASIVLKNGTKVTLVCTQSALPSLSIRLKDMDRSEIDADEDHKKTAELESTILSDPMNPVNNFSLNGHAEIRGRGNSSWAFYDKRGYQIRLENSRSVLGMDKAKKWILLANSSDSTLMRNKLVFDIARSFDIGYVPDCRYADLWIDGDYRGVYLIAEKVEIGKQRLNLTSGHGILAEFDNAFYNQEVHFQDIDENYWALKEFQAEDATEDFAEYERRVNAFAEALNEHRPWEEITPLIDEKQFARFYLIAEYFLNEELATTSFFWYWDGPKDELHMGPIWDFDTCMADGDPADVYYVWRNSYFKGLLKYEEFVDLLSEYYEKYCRDIFELAPVTMDLLNVKIGPSAEMNYLRFDVLGREDVKDHMFYATYKENLEVQKEWLRERRRTFAIEDICSEITDYYLTMKVSDDNSKLYLSVRTKKALKTMQFYVMTEATNNADRTRYEAKLDENGRWVCEVDLIDFNQTGKYTVEAFVNGTNRNPDASAEFVLDEPPTVSYVVDGVDYSAVFDPEYYGEKYPDAKNACGDNPAKLFDHFFETGMKTRRKGNEDFDVDFYMQDNPDLVTKYGTDYAAYYKHYCEFGKSEGRPGTRED